MSITTFEGVVDNGLIRLTTEVHLPDHTRVLAIVPDTATRPAWHVYSPRLVRPEQAADFVKEVIEVPASADV